MHSARHLQHSFYLFHNLTLLHIRHALLENRSLYGNLFCVQLQTKKCVFYIITREYFGDLEGLRWLLETWKSIRLYLIFLKEHACQKVQSFWRQKSVTMLWPPWNSWPTTIVTASVSWDPIREELELLLLQSFNISLSGLPSDCHTVLKS